MEVVEGAGVVSKMEVAEGAGVVRKMVVVKGAGVVRQMVGVKGTHDEVIDTDVASEVLEASASL